MADREPAPSPDVRRAFLDERRRTSIERLDLASATYDTDWGAMAPSHARFVERVLAGTREHAMVLDAACGTGKYWPMVLASGRTVVGTDQSAGMLAAAATKHPEVPVARVGLQDLVFDAAFDAVLCIDAMEYVGPEDWPVVLAALRRAVRPGGLVYLTVELPDADELREHVERARAAGEPVVASESVYPAGYHHFPDRADVERWLAAAGLDVLADEDADEYRHLLLRRPDR